MSDSHNCASTVGALAGMLTSLTICLESDVWSCREPLRNKQFAAISIIFFLIVNATQHLMKHQLVPVLNGFAAILPSVLFVGNELVYCDKRMAVISKENFDRTAQLARIVPTLLLPLAIYFVSGSSSFHDMVCGGLHAVQMKAPSLGGGTTSSHDVAMTNGVQQRARAALNSARIALNSANGSHGHGAHAHSASVDFSNDFSN